jgi:flagellar assembly protein FliH
MSTSAAERHPESTILTRVSWRPPASADGPDAVRPFFAAEPGPHASSDTRELVLPSVIAQRAAAAEREGYERGFREGERAGQDAAHVRADAALARLAATIDEVASLRSLMFHRSEQDIVRLAIAIAERVLRRETRANPQLIETMARAAARKFGGHSGVTILMNPDDLAALAASRAASPDDGPIRLKADAAIPSGGCLVQSSLGTIDVSLDSQLGELLDSLLADDAGDADPGAAGDRG